MKIQAQLLIIDDDKEILESLSDALAQVFSDVTSSSNADHAVETLNRNKFDLIICDHKMPQVTGLELIKIFRSEGCNIPIILHSGYVSKEVAISAMRLGVIDIIEKPCNMDEFCRTILRALLLEKQKARYYSGVDVDDSEPRASHEKNSEALATLQASVTIDKQ